MKTCKTSTFTMGILVPLILLGASLHSQRALAQENEVIQQLIGSWEGRGELFGSAAAFSMKWEWVLEQRFLRLSFENGMQGPDGVEPVLQAMALYKPIDEGRLEGTWYDSRGMVLPLEVTTNPTTLTTQWGSPDTERGRTVYRLLGQDKVEVEDFILRDDEWHQFGHATYQRQR